MTHYGCACYYWAVYSLELFMMSSFVTCSVTFMFVCYVCRSLFYLKLFSRFFFSTKKKVSIKATRNSHKQQTAAASLPSGSYGSVRIKGVKHNEIYFCFVFISPEWNFTLLTTRIIHFHSCWLRWLLPLLLLPFFCFYLLRWIQGSNEREWKWRPEGRNEMNEKRDCE